MTTIIPFTEVVNNIHQFHPYPGVLESGACRELAGPYADLEPFPFFQHSFLLYRGPSRAPNIIFSLVRNCYSYVVLELVRSSIVRLESVRNIKESSKFT